MREGIAVAGNLIVDYVKLIDSYPEQGNLANVLSISRSVGGAPANVGIDLSKIDDSIPLQTIGIVGDDEDGEYVVSMLKKRNIDTSQIKKSISINTSFTDVMTVQSTGERSFFHYRGANQILNVEHFDFNKINANFLHMGYALLLDALDSGDNEYGSVMARVLFMAQQHGIKTSLDVVSENSNRFSKIIPHSLKYCNYFIVNEFEASMTAQIPVRDRDGRLVIKNIEKICDKLFLMGVNDLVVIHTPEGGFAMEQDGMFYKQPSLDLPENYIKGTVGAGDAFCAGMLYSIYNDWCIERGLKFAVSAAACCLSHVNATDGMKDASTIEALYTKTKKGDCFML